MINLNLLEAARQSVVEDPDFDMATWDHCVAGHICKVGGLSVESQRGVHPVLNIPCRSYSVMVNGVSRSVSEMACELAGDKSVEALFSFIPGCETIKDRTLSRFDAFLAARRLEQTQVTQVALAPEAVPDLELVCA